MFGKQIIVQRVQDFELGVLGCDRQAEFRGDGVQHDLGSETWIDDVDDFAVGR